MARGVFVATEMDNILLVFPDQLQRQCKIVKTILKDAKPVIGYTNILVATSAFEAFATVSKNNDIGVVIADLPCPTRCACFLESKR